MDAHNLSVRSGDARGQEAHYLLVSDGMLLDVRQQVSRLSHLE